MIRAGHERARRNLHDTWALRRSQPLVTLGPSGLVANGTGRRGPGQSASSTNLASDAARLSTVRPQSAAPAGRPHGQPADRPVAGSSAVTWPSKPVSTSRPPMSSAAVTTSEWATRQATVPSGSMANVSISAWTTTCARRGDPSSARIGVADRWFQRGVAGRRLEAVAVEPVGDDEQPGAVPVERPRLVVDERGEPGRPGAARSLETQLGAAQRVGVGGDQRPEVDQLAARLGQGEDLGRRAAAAPPPARPQPARVGDRGVARLAPGPCVGRGQPSTRVTAARAGSPSRPLPSRPARHPRPRARPRPGPCLGDRRDGRVGQDAQGPRRDREDRRRQAGRRPDDRVAPRSGIHDHPDRSVVADRRDPADGEPGQVVRLARRRASDVGRAGDGRQPRDVDPVVAGHEAQDRARGRPRSGRRRRAT